MKSSAESAVYMCVCMHVCVCTCIALEAGLESKRGIRRDFDAARVLNSTKQEPRQITSDSM
jgi:hypothetical protein